MISNLYLSNYTIGLHINNSTDIDIKKCRIFNSSYGISYISSNYIVLHESYISSDNNSISSDNSHNLFMINSTIQDQSNLNFLLSNSDITVLNSTFNDTKIQFQRPDAPIVNLLVWWIMHHRTSVVVSPPIRSATTGI